MVALADNPTAQSVSEGTAADTQAWLQRAPRLLLIDPCPNLRDQLSALFAACGCQTLGMQEGESGLETAQLGDYDLVVMEVCLPNQDGFDVLRALRSSHPRIPVILLTNRTRLHDRIRGLNLGADDYILKPFVAAELVARVRSVLRRTRPLVARCDCHGDLRIDRGARRVWIKTTEVGVTRIEFAVLALLMEVPGEVVSRAAITRAIYGRSFADCKRVVDVHVCHLRRKLRRLQGVRIKTIRQIGFVLTGVLPGVPDVTPEYAVFGERIG